MSIDKLKRVMWRLRELDYIQKRVPLKALRLAVMYECGTDRRTITDNISKLVELGWIKRVSRWSYWIQGGDSWGE